MMRWADGKEGHDAVAVRCEGVMLWFYIFLQSSPAVLCQFFPRTTFPDRFCRREQQGDTREGMAITNVSSRW